MLIAAANAEKEKSWGHAYTNEKALKNKLLQNNVLSYHSYKKKPTPKPKVLAQIG